MLNVGSIPRHSVAWLAAIVAAAGLILALSPVQSDPL
jgi:hypothetical protein